jgi:hypothetical protein
VLAWRLQRLTQRPAPSERARAAQARSTLAIDRTTGAAPSPSTPPPMSDLAARPPRTSR